MSTPDQRNALRQYYADVERVFAEYQAAKAAYDTAFDAWMYLPLGRPQPLMPTIAPLPKFPEECRGMTCGAKTRQGHSCRQTNIYHNGRCKFHGGASTGPVTAKGKHKSAKNGLKKRSP